MSSAQPRSLLRRIFRGIIMIACFAVLSAIVLFVIGLNELSCTIYGCGNFTISAQPVRLEYRDAHLVREFEVPAGFSYAYLEDIVHVETSRALLTAYNARHETPTLPYAKWSSVIMIDIILPTPPAWELPLSTPKNLNTHVCLKLPPRDVTTSNYFLVPFDGGQQLVRCERSDCHYNIRKDNDGYGYTVTLQAAEACYWPEVMEAVDRFVTQQVTLKMRSDTLNHRLK